MRLYMYIDKNPTQCKFNMGIHVCNKVQKHGRIGWWLFLGREGAE